MLGFDRESRIINLEDSAELNAFLYDADDNPVDFTTIDSVTFTIRKPDGSYDSVDGDVQDDGMAYAIYDGTDQEGEYVVVAQFKLTTGITRSTRSDFLVTNPFAAVSNQGYLDEYQTLTNVEDQAAWQVGLVAARVWDKMEDLFDSEDGGPWMKDMTMNVFSPEKIPEFIEEALFDINVYNPPTHLWIDTFASPSATRNNPNLTILVQGTWVAVIRHLMRTYTEQPLPSGGQVTYEDRRDYLQRWGTIYQIEFQHYDHLVKLWKRQFLDLGVRKNLVSSKAGRLLPAPLRSRNIGRGYY